MTDLTELKALIDRAQASGRTDEDRKKLDLINKLGKAVIGLIESYADKDDGLGGLDATEIVKTLAGVIGATIRACSPDQFSSINLLGEINLLLLEIILDSDPNPGEPE